jgi:methyl-accepting chemotaxis protein
MGQVNLHHRAVLFPIGGSGHRIDRGGFAIAITRAITRPLVSAVQIAQTVAAGDPTLDVQATSRDETGQLIAALGLMSKSLAEVVRNVCQGTDTIATASGQIAAGNQDLSQRTEEQASSLEETAASMEELTGRSSRTRRTPGRPTSWRRRPRHSPPTAGKSSAR